MKRMLFNATHQEELRVAIVDGQKLLDIDIETAGREQRKGNIYKGVITRIEPSLEACFVNYGHERHGFLPFKEVARSYFKEGVDVRNVRIQDALAEGQELIIQVEKEERGNKGAALTTFISLAGRYLVLMPNNPRGGGVSRRIDGEERQELRETMSQLDLPEGMSMIARTAGIGRTAPELDWDLKYLLKLWNAIFTASQQYPAPVLIYQESSLVIRAIRDYFSPDIAEILIDTDNIHNQALAFMQDVMPENVQKVKRYRNAVPLFSRFQVEHQIETAYSRNVQLPSGGSIVIDHTEALVAVDVNSARSTRGTDIEETAMRTNLEAAEEVARQLRLRDLGGLIVIDFIDMEDSKNQRAVEQKLRDALHVDRARVQMGKISRFGLMELSRQRLRPSLNEGSHVTCPRCNGTGVIRDVESSALNILRLLVEEAMKENTAAIYAQVPVEVATYLLNEKRTDIVKIETRLKVRIYLIPNKNIETPHHDIERVRYDDPRMDEQKSSLEMIEAPENTTLSWQDKKEKDEEKQRPEAIVKGIHRETPAPTPAVTPAVKAQEPTIGFFQRIKAWFMGTPATPSVEASQEKKELPAQPKHNRQDKQRNRPRRPEKAQDDDKAIARKAKRAEELKAAKEANKEAAKEQVENRQSRRQNRKQRQETSAEQANTTITKETSTKANNNQNTAPKEVLKETQNKPQKVSATDADTVSTKPANFEENSTRLESSYVTDVDTSSQALGDDIIDSATDNATGEDFTNDQGEARKRRRRNRRGRRPNDEAKSITPNENLAFIPNEVLLEQQEAQQGQVLSQQQTTTPAEANNAFVPATVAGVTGLATIVVAETINHNETSPEHAHAPDLSEISPVATVKEHVPETANLSETTDTTTSVSSIVEPATLVPSPVPVFETTDTVAPVVVSETVPPVAVDLPQEVEPPVVSEVIVAAKLDDNSTTEEDTSVTIVQTSAIEQPMNTVSDGKSVVDTATLTQVVESAGMQWIQTKPDLVVEITPPSIKLGRARKPVQAISNEPLILVETDSSKK